MNQMKTFDAIRWGLLSLLAAAVVALAFTVGYAVGDDGATTTAPAVTTTTRPDSGETAGDFTVLDEILDILERNHIDRRLIDPELMRLGAINGVIDQLNDPHTTYLGPSNFACGIDVLTGTYEGIGATVDTGPNGEIVIVAPFSGSPAEQAGMRPGDVILEVDGESTAGWTRQEAVCTIRGPADEPVELKVLHTDGAEELITIVRDRIVVESVQVLDITDAEGTPIQDIAYLVIQQFTERTPQEIQQALRQVSPNNTKGIIIDLRVNPGGLLTATVNAVDLFLDEGVILIEVDGDGNRRTFSAQPGTVTDLPVAVLMGPGSASGAEVFAAALRDNGRATLIGLNTFGKGAVNNLYNLQDGGGLYVTIARWETPNGELIEGLGVAPDIEVKPSDEDIDQRRDVQLFRAIDLLRSQAAGPAPASQ